MEKCNVWFHSAYYHRSFLCCYLHNYSHLPLKYETTFSLLYHLIFSVFMPFSFCGMFGYFIECAWFSQVMCERNKLSPSPDFRMSHMSQRIGHHHRRKTPSVRCPFCYCFYRYCRHQIYDRLRWWWKDKIRKKYHHICHRGSHSYACRIPVCQYYREFYL